jgi:hypothetical protein
LLRREYHNDTVGILVCGTKNDPNYLYSETEDLLAFAGLYGVFAFPNNCRTSGT